MLGKKEVHSAVVEWNVCSLGQKSYHYFFYKGSEAVHILIVLIYPSIDLKKSVLSLHFHVSKADLKFEQI